MLQIPGKEPSEGHSSPSYSPHAFQQYLKPDVSHRSPDDDDDSALTNSLTSQSLNADGTPKRPMNAFMVFARRRRPQVSAENQTMRTGEISKILSREWNSMETAEKQFYLDQAKQLKDVFNSKYPDYVYRRRPNNSRKKRRTDASPYDIGYRSCDEPSPTEGDEQDEHQHIQYPSFGNPEVLDELFTHPQNSSTLTYSQHPYPQSASHRHLTSHPPPHELSTRPSLHGSLSLAHSSHSNHIPSLRSAPVYSTHEQPSLVLPQIHHPNGGNGYHSQSPQSGYWSGYSDRDSQSPSHNTPSDASSTSPNPITTPGPSSQWVEAMLPSIPSYQFNPVTRERSYTTNSLPAMKSTFPHLSSPCGVHHQLPSLPLPPPLHSNGHSPTASASGGSTSAGHGMPHRPWSSGPGSHNNGTYLPTLSSPFYPQSSGSGSVASASPASASGGYFPSPPSTTSSTSNGTAGGGDGLLTPPELTNAGEIGIGSNFDWDRK